LIGEHSHDLRLVLKMLMQCVSAVDVFAVGRAAGSKGKEAASRAENSPFGRQKASLKAYIACLIISECNLIEDAEAVMGDVKSSLMNKLQRLIARNAELDEAALDLILEGMGRVFQKYTQLILSCGNEDSAENIFQVVWSKFQSSGSTIKAATKGMILQTFTKLVVSLSARSLQEHDDRQVLNDL